MSKIDYVVLKSKSGFSVKVLTLGGIITEIMAKDKYGKRENVVLNYENLDDYLSNPLFLGCFIGPIAGRTENGRMYIDDHLIKLDVSDHSNALHSGKDGLHNAIWLIQSHEADQLVLTYDAKPLNAQEGDLNYQLTYTVSDEALTIDLFVKSTKKTYLSLTNHSYFNLTGDTAQNILAHNLKLNCSHFARLDPESLPLEIVTLDALKLDFTSEMAIESIINAPSQVFVNTSGIDHPFKCSASDYVAQLSDPQTGRVMHVATTQPYVIIYSGNFLHTATSQSGKQFKQYSGICFETQDLPNVVNSKLDAVHFITPESPYSHRTTFSFSTI